MMINYDDDNPLQKEGDFSIPFSDIPKELQEIFLAKKGFSIPGQFGKIKFLYPLKLLLNRSQQEYVNLCRESITNCTLSFGRFRVQIDPKTTFVDEINLILAEEYNPCSKISWVEVRPTGEKDLYFFCKTCGEPTDYHNKYAGSVCKHNHGVEESKPGYFRALGIVDLIGKMINTLDNL
jgi:hypothetical protein